MHVETVAEMQDVYRPNVSMYDMPSMSRARGQLPVPGLDTLDIFLVGFFHESVGDADVPLRSRRAVRFQARSVTLGGDDILELPTWGRVESITTEGTHLGSVGRIVWSLQHWNPMPTPLTLQKESVMVRTRPAIVQRRRVLVLTMSGM